jgi:hypothetical protein
MQQKEEANKPPLVVRYKISESASVLPKAPAVTPARMVEFATNIVSEPTMAVKVDSEFWHKKATPLDANAKSSTAEILATTSAAPVALPLLSMGTLLNTGFPVFE